MQGSANEAKDSDYIRIGVRAGGARGLQSPQILGNSDVLGSERKFGQSQFLRPEY